MPQDGLRDRRDLLGRLALGEYDLREPLPDRPVMVDLGEVQVLVGQVSKRGDRVLYAEAPLADLV